MVKLKVFIVFLVSAFIICASEDMSCEDDSSNNCVVIRGIESYGNIPETYQKRLDKRVPFPQLSNAIKEIDEHMGDYQGTARDNMDSLRSLNNGLEDTYHECVAPVFNWCTSSDMTFKLYITYVSDREGRTKESLINMLTKKILEGHEKMTSSLSTLKKVIENTTSIKNVLGKIHYDLKQDFGPEGYYGKKIQELQNSRGHRQRRELMFIFQTGLKFIVCAAQAVLRLVYKETGIALGLRGALRSAGVPRNVVKMKKEPQYDESIKIIETLYTVLDEKIRKARRYAEEAHKALIQDSYNLNALHGVLIASNDTLKVQNTDIENEMIDAITNVRTKCLAYTNWHNNPDHSNYASRQRRDTGNVNFQQRESNGTLPLNQDKISISFKKIQGNALNFLYDNAMFAKY